MNHVEYRPALPDAWRWQPIDSLASVKVSTVDKKSYEDELPVSLCNYTDVYYNDEITGTLDFMRATASCSQVANFTVRAGDVVITKDSETSDDIGRPAYVPGDLPGVVYGYHLAIYRPFDLRYGKFLRYLFDSTWVRAELRSRTPGVTRVGLNQETLRHLRIPVPSALEARKIADYLDRETAEIDAFVSDLQVLSFLAREHFNSLRSKTLRQPSSVEKNPDSHSVPLTRVLPHRVDYRGATPIKVDEGIQLVTARNIRPGWIDYESSQEFVSSEDYSQVMSRGLPARGDILFTMEAPLGNAALVDRTDVALAQRVIKFTPAPGVDPSFMCHVMNSDEFQHQLRELATGSTALGLKASKLHQLQVLVPDLATQTQAVRTLDEAWASVVDLQHLVDEATRLASERRAALISAAVTGQIDVTEQSVSAAERLRDELGVHV